MGEVDYIQRERQKRSNTRRRGQLTKPHAKRNNISKTVERGLE